MKKLCFYLCLFTLIFTLTSCNQAESGNTDTAPPTTTDDSKNNSKDDSSNEDEAEQEKEKEEEKNADNEGPDDYLPEYVPDEVLQWAALAVLSGPEHKMKPIIDSLLGPVNEFSFDGGWGDTDYSAVLISANNDATFEIMAVTGWDDATNSLQIDDPFLTLNLDRAQAMVLHFNETEGMPLQICRITAEDGHTQSFYDFGYDGEGSDTVDGITRRVVYYGQPDEIVTDFYSETLDLLLYIAQEGVD